LGIFFAPNENEIVNEALLCLRMVPFYCLSLVPINNRLAREIGERGTEGKREIGQGRT
jgi:hypothetical protein